MNTSVRILSRLSQTRAGKRNEGQGDGLWVLLWDCRSDLFPSLSILGQAALDAGKGQVLWLVTAAICYSQRTTSA